MATVAVLGTGLLGAGFARNLLGKGHAVRVWNRTRAKAEPLGALGAVVADSPAAAAAGAARVHLILADDAAVDAVVAELPAGTRIVDHSTVTPAGVVRRVAALGERYVHAPVFMGPKNAAEATGIMMVCGPRAAVEPLHGALQDMTGKLVDLGDRPDLAAVYKLCGNAMLIAMVASMSDVIAVARGAGADPVAVFSMFDWFDLSGVPKFRGPKLAAGQFGPATFELAMARKDVRLMLDTAASDHPIVLPAIAARMDELLAAGLAADDYTVLARPR